MFSLTKHQLGAHLVLMLFKLHSCCFYEHCLETRDGLFYFCKFTHSALHKPTERPDTSFSMNASSSWLLCHTLTWTLHLISSRLQPTPQRSAGRRSAETDMESWCQVVLCCLSSLTSSASQSSSIQSAPLCVFAHIYYSLCSLIATPCYLLNIKHPAIMRDLFGQGRALQTSFESKCALLNDIRCSRMDTEAHVKCISRQMDGYWGLTKALGFVLIALLCNFLATSALNIITLHCK